MLLAIVFAHVWGVLELVALASLTRTIRARTALAALGAGLYTCSLTAILLQTGWTQLVARLASKYLFEIVQIASYTLDPFIEEFVKVLPLIVLIWMIPSVRRQWSTADCVVIGAASGAGFGLAENLFRFSGEVNKCYPVNGGWEVVKVMSVSQPTVPSLTTSLTSWLPAGVAGGNPFSSGLSPDHFNVHLEWSALAGLAVALIFLTRSNLSRVAGVILWLYVGADHAANNLTLSGRTVTLSVLAAPLNSLRGVLCLMPAVALVVAWWLDRTRQQAARAPELALATERHSTSRIFGVLQSALARPPRSILWVENLILTRRAYATNSCSQPDSAKEVQQAVIILRDRTDRLTDGLKPLAPEAHHGGAGKDRSFFRQPQFFVWLLLMLPSVAWFVVGGFPQTVWLQSALKTPAGWIVVRTFSFLSLAWMGTQLILAARRSSRVPRGALGEVAAASTLRLVAGAGAFVFGVYSLVLALTAGAADSRVLTNFHVLEAVASAQVIGTLLTATAAVGLFPPVVPTMGAVPSSSGDMSQETQVPEPLRPEGELSMVKTVDEDAGILRPTDGPVTVEAVFDGLGNQVFPTPDDYSDIPQRLLHVALDSWGMAADQVGGLVEAIDKGADGITGSLDMADAYYDGEPAKLIQAALDTSIGMAAPEATPLLIAKGGLEIGARLAGMTPQQIDAVEAQATQDALNSLAMVPGVDAANTTFDALENLFFGQSSSGGQ